MPHVFISYSRIDTAFVEALEHDLNARRIDTWRDVSDIPPGSPEWHNAVADALDDAHVVALVVTPNSDVSRWVAREVLYADQIGLPIIAVMPSDYRPRQHLRLIVVSAQPVRFDDPSYEGLDQLVASLKDYLKSPRPVAGRMGPIDFRTAEIRYLDFLLAEMKAELRTARYVNLGATRESIVLWKSTPAGDLDEFELSFERFEPLVKAERIHGEQLDQPGEQVDDARVPLREMARAILLGEPGSGKTTTLQQLAIDLAGDAKNALQAHTPPGDQPKLPVFVPLRSYSGETTFAEFVRGQLGPLQNQYERLLSAGRLVLLCDALNEMQRSGNGRNLVDEVRSYLKSRQPWVVSCRVRDYQEELQGLPDVGKVRLKPLDLPRIKQVIDRRFHEKPERAAALWTDLKGSDDLLAASQAFEEAGRADVFWGREWPDGLGNRYNDKVYPLYRARQNMHSDRRRMMPLCQNPFMLFMVCGTFERLGHLPPNRGALFATFVDNLLRREEQSSRATGRAWIDANIIRRGLAALAYAMQKSETGTEITRAEAEQILGAQLDTPDPALVLLGLAASANLLDVGERVRYTHQLLQEYFASEVMGAALDEKRSPTEFWPADNWWVRQGWEETAVILAGVRGDPESVARWIAPAQPEVAYQALTECGVEMDLNEIHPETRAALVDSAKSKKGEPNPVGRAAAYRVLSLFDADNRPGIGLRPDGLPDIDWVEIEADVFIFGDEGERNGPVPLTLPTFYISRYPITYAQFQAFLDASDGFQRDEWWKDLTPIYRKQEMWDQVFKYGNHPRDTVSWYQAVAFCDWLSAKFGFEVRLPTEQEWEKAARGTYGREYPYDGEFDANNGNTSETGIRQTSAVGIFPNGVSPYGYGVLDMSGNVSEWCLNEHYHPEKTSCAGNATRVLRGGSWRLDMHLARCAYRDRDAPSYGDDNIGFRVVCARPMP